MSIDIKPFGNPLIGWKNVLHFTTGSTGKHGSRIPAIFFLPKTFVPHVCSSVNGSHNFAKNLQQLEVNVWSNIIIMQHRISESGQYVYRVFQDNKEAVNVINNNIQEFQDVTVRLNSLHSLPPNANIKNLFYTNLEK